MNVSLIPHVRLLRLLVLTLALFAPVMAFAGWSLPSYPQAGVPQTISWFGYAPAPMVTMSVRAPGSSNWSAIYANGVTNGQASLTATFSFPAAGTWALEITDLSGATVDTTYVNVIQTIIDTQAPTAPGTPTAVGVTSNSITITWAASSDDVGVTGYEVSINGNSPVTVVTKQASFVNLASSTSYHFEVKARDAAGHLSSPSSNDISTVAAPTFVNINGWSFPSHPLVGQGYYLSWQGFIYGANYVMLFYKAPGSSTWEACGGGGSTNGYISASGGWGANAPGVWEFGVGINGATPTSTSVSITVY